MESHSEGEDTCTELNKVQNPERQKPASVFETGEEWVRGPLADDRFGGKQRGDVPVLGCSDVTPLSSFGDCTFQPCEVYPSVVSVLAAGRPSPQPGLEAIYPEETADPLAATRPFPASTSPAAGARPLTWSFLSPWKGLLWTCVINGITWHALFCDGLLSLARRFQGSALCVTGAIPFRFGA